MAPHDRDLGQLLSRIKGEYREMPGLSVNLSQACRLWHVDQDTCQTVLGRLVQDRYLRQTRKGLFIRSLAS